MLDAEGKKSYIFIYINMYISGFKFKLLEVEVISTFNYRHIKLSLILASYSRVKT